MAAFLSAVIFAVHTVNLHTVAWIPGRNDSLYNQRGIARMRIGLYREALADFDKAIELRPASDAIRSNRNLAIAAMNPGNPGK